MKAEVLALVVKEYQSKRFSIKEVNELPDFTKNMEVNYVAESEEI